MKQETLSTNIVATGSFSLRVDPSVFIFRIWKKIFLEALITPDAPASTLPSTVSTLENVSMPQKGKKKSG